MAVEGRSEPRRGCRAQQCIYVAYRLLPVCYMCWPQQVLRAAYRMPRYTYLLSPYSEPRRLEKPPSCPPSAPAARPAAPTGPLPIPAPPPAGRPHRRGRRAKQASAPSPGNGAPGGGKQLRPHAPRPQTNARPGTSPHWLPAPPATTAGPTSDMRLRSICLGALLPVVRPSTPPSRTWYLPLPPPHHNH